MNTSGQRAANNQGERREGAGESISGGGGGQGKHRYDCTAKSSIIEELRNAPRKENVVGSTIPSATALALCMRGQN